MDQAKKLPLNITITPSDFKFGMNLHLYHHGWQQRRQLSQRPTQATLLRLGEKERGMMIILCVPLPARPAGIVPQAQKDFT